MILGHLYQPIPNSQTPLTEYLLFKTLGLPPYVNSNHGSLAITTHKFIPESEVGLWYILPSKRAVSGFSKTSSPTHLARTHRIDANWIQSFDIETCQPTKLIKILMRITDKQSGIDPDTMPIASYLNQKLKRKFIPSTFEEALEMCNDITEASDYLVGLNLNLTG